MRTDLTVEDLGDLLDKPLVAVLATLRMDGSVLLRLKRLLAGR